MPRSLFLCSCSCVVWVMSMSMTGDNTLFTRTATAPTIPSYSGFGRYVCDISVHRCLNTGNKDAHMCHAIRQPHASYSEMPFPHAACDRSALLLIKDQSLFRRAGLFALMKELRVKAKHAKHTNTLQQQTTQREQLTGTVHKPFTFDSHMEALFDVCTV